MGTTSQRIRVFILTVCLFVSTISGWPALAQQQPNVFTGCPHSLRPGVPFAWLRTDPSVHAAFGPTLTPGQTVQLNDPPLTAWDGMQWWVAVWPNVPGPRNYLWVELNSLMAICQTATPTPPAGGGAAPWQPGNLVRVRFNVPFVWFRGAPAPGNPPIHTVLPGTQLTIIQGATMDSFNQWWWLMRDTRNGQTGWVEQNVVELVSGTSPNVPSAGWQFGDVVRVKASIPFSWLRFAPSSTGGVLLIARPLQELVVNQGQQYDGVQSWWRVTVPNTRVSGWVEENSLEFVRRGS